MQFLGNKISLGLFQDFIDGYSKYEEYPTDELRLCSGSEFG